MISKRQKKKRTGLRRAMDQTRTTAGYPGVGQGLAPALSYVGLGLAGEAGEVANQLKKVMRDDGGVLCPAREAKLFDELGDVLWYWLRMCDELGFDPYAVMDHNLAKLAARQREGTLQGDTAADGSRGRAVVPQPTEEQTAAPIFPVATADMLGGMFLTRWVGRTAYVVDQQQAYQVGEDGEWHPVDSGAALRFGPDEELTRLKFKWGITYPPHAEDGDVVDVAGYLATYREGEGWVCEWEHNLLELGPHPTKDGYVVARDPQTGEPWDGSAAPADEVPSVLEAGGGLANDPERFATSQEAWKRLVDTQTMPGHDRDMHLVECHCTCADGGPWKISGYRLFGITQEMYRHLTEQHVAVAGE